MSNLTLIQINSICIFIDNSNIEQKNKEKSIRENYEYLEQNINTGTFDSKDVSIAVNKIIVDFKFLFEENFKYINNFKITNELKTMLEAALGFLRKFKEYLDKELINTTIFNTFEDFVLDKINSIGGIRTDEDKIKLYEKVCIFEILEKENLSHIVYQQEQEVYQSYRTHFNQHNYNVFTDEILNKYHSLNYIKVLRMFNQTEQRNPKNETELYFNLINHFNEILGFENDHGKFLLKNIIIEKKI